MPDHKTQGKVQISDDVITSIAGNAVMEAEGVAGMTGHLAGKMAGKKTAKGINLQVVNGQVIISLAIIVKYGCKVQQVAMDVQERVKNAIETMTGFSTAEVNVTVAGLVA